MAALPLSASGFLDTFLNPASWQQSDCNYKNVHAVSALAFQMKPRPYEQYNSMQLAQFPCKLSHSNFSNGLNGQHGSYCSAQKFKEQNCQFRIKYNIESETYKNQSIDQQILNNKTNSSGMLLELCSSSSSSQHRAFTLTLSQMISLKDLPQCQQKPDAWENIPEFLYVVFEKNFK